MARRAPSNRVSNRWASAYADFADEMQRRFSRLKPRRPRPSYLYHFTDCDGLVGILHNKTIWASLATSLNDRSETQHGFAVIKRLIENRQIKTKWLPLDRLVQSFDQPQTWRHYVVSFCAQSGTALHWLHYGRSGSGVAVGFDTQALKQAARKQNFQLFPVLYDEKRQEAWLQRLIDVVDSSLGTKLQRLRSRFDRALMVDVALNLTATELWTIAPRMKSPVFTPELEWRLVSSIPKRADGLPVDADRKRDLNFRSSVGRIVPFKKLEFDILPAVEIVLGSSTPIRQDPLALNVLMEETLGAPIRILDSPVPIRA